MIQTSVAELTKHIAGGKAPQCWIDAWNDDLSGLSGELKLDYMEIQLSSLSMDNARRQEVLNNFKSVQSVPLLLKLTRVLQALFFAPAVSGKLIADEWPEILDSDGQPLTFFLTLPMLLEIPALKKKAMKRGIPEDIVFAGLEDIDLWMKDHQQKHGCPGFSNPFWISNFLKAKIFRLGRLQFELGKYDFNYSGWRNQQDDRVIFLAPGKFDISSQPGWYSTDSDHGSTWKTCFQEDEATVSGNPVSPIGKIIQQKISLNKKEWKCVLKKDDPILGIHIRAEGPMDHALCGASIDQARQFFPHYFPEHQYRAFTCCSWLMAPQLEQYLNPESNIVRFLREFYIYPVFGAEDSQFFIRVFGRRFEHIDEAPQNNSLQKALVKHIKRGGEWRYAAGAILAEDQVWGHQPYRHQLETEWPTTEKQV